MPQRIQVRRDSTDDWEDGNPMLAAGELGVEYGAPGAPLLKVGDGSASWQDLHYINGLAVYVGVTVGGNPPLYDEIWTGPQPGSLIFIPEGNDPGIWRASGTPSLDPVLLFTTPLPFLWVATMSFNSIEDIPASPRPAGVTLVHAGSIGDDALTTVLTVSAQNSYLDASLTPNAGAGDVLPDVASVLSELDRFFGVTGSIPAPPESGTYVATATNGTVTWEPA